MKFKFRIIDIFILVACVVALVLFVDKINIADGRSQVLQEDEEAEITVTVPYIEAEIANKIEVGAPFKDALDPNPIGTVKNVDISDPDKSDYTFNNKTLEFDNDLYKKVVITVKTTGKRTEKGILIGQTNYLVGQTNTFSAGIVKLFSVRISGINYSGE